VHEFTYGHSHFFVTNLIYQSPEHERVILSLVTLPNLYWPSSLSSLLYLPSLSVQELDLACELQSTRNDQKDPLSVHTPQNMSVTGIVTVAPADTAWLTALSTSSV
jgi:hypothetical protein